MTQNYSFGDLQTVVEPARQSAGRRMACERGDRDRRSCCPQAPETAFAHIAIHKARSGISIPLFTLFGEEALEYRLSDSGARKVLITNRRGRRETREQIRDRLPALETGLQPSTAPPPARAISTRR